MSLNFLLYNWRDYKGLGARKIGAENQKHFHNEYPRQS